MLFRSEANAEKTAQEFERFIKDPHCLGIKLYPGYNAVLIELEKLDEENIGELIYFFEKACSVSGMILGVNPFNQPGAVSYTHLTNVRFRAFTYT